MTSPYLDDEWQRQLRIRKTVIILDEYQRTGDYRAAMRQLTRIGLSDTLAHNILTGQVSVEDAYSEGPYPR
jgi:hypothetical protein